MIPNTKCLWTILVTVVISILSEQLCRGNTFEQHTSGETFQDSNPRNTETLVQNDDLKRGWAKFASWGKRGFNNNFSVWGKRENLDDDNTIAQLSPDKRAWSKFASWGKRDSSFESDKRDWSGFHSWGKRQQETIDDPMNFELRLENLRSMDLPETDKRRWSPMATWGKRYYDKDYNNADKRRWSEFTSWGKRAEPDQTFTEPEKRKWAKFASWGKRSESDIDELNEDKRKWSKFASWGKRDGGELDKRRWSQLPTWGKRSGVTENELMAAKRAWSRSSWGKRYRTVQPWVNLGAWGKRRWTGLATWGKRSADYSKYEVDVDTAAQKLLNFFDLNGDGALDMDELRIYIRTLMSLPSKQEQGDSKQEMTQEQ